MRPKAAQRRKNKGMKSTLLLAAATVAVLTAVNAATAAEPLLSPKAKALADSLRTVPSTASTVDLTKDRPIGNAKAWELARSFRTAPSTGPSVDLAHGPRPMLSPKDPRYEQVARELRESNFQVAPFK